MTSRELEKEVWQLIDDNCRDMSKEEYLDFLKGIRDDSQTRIECVELEIEDEGE